MASRDPARPTEVSRWTSRLGSPVLVASGLAGASLLVSAWMLPYRVPPSDAGALLTQASRILDGAVFYRDLDAYPLPGAPYLLALVMKLFGEHLSVARGLAAVIYAVLVVAVYACALRLVAPRRAALVGTALLGLKFVAWPAFTSYLYADLAVAFACISIALFLRHPPRGPSWILLAAGTCAGLALASKQTVGLYLAAASVLLLLLPERLLGAERTPALTRLREAATYGAGMALALTPLIGFCIAQGVLPTLVRSGFVRPLTAYLPTSGISFTTPLRWWELGTLGRTSLLPYSIEPWWQMLRTGHLPGEALQPLYSLLGELFSRLLYTSVPLAFGALVLAFARGRRSGTLAAERELWIFGALSGAVLLSAFPRADFPHVIVVYPLVGVLGVALAERFAHARLGQRARRLGRRLEVASVGCALALCFSLTAWHQAALTHPLVLERAELRISPENAYSGSIVRYLQESVPPGRPIFVFVHEAHYYFLADRYSPWRFVQLYPGMTGEEGGFEVVSLLERDPPQAVVRGLTWAPGLPPLEEYAPRLFEHLRYGYYRDSRAFERYPPAGGVAYAWVLRPVPEELRRLRER